MIPIQPMGFDPIRAVPTTDAEAVTALGYRARDSSAMVAIFELWRMVGVPLVDAYEFALLSYVDLAAYDARTAPYRHLLAEHKAAHPPSDSPGAGSSGGE